MDVSTVLKRASEKSGCRRIRYRDSDVPTSIESVTVMPFFGDQRSSFVLSSILMRRIKEELKGSRYFVMISWPGDEGLYNCVDEYWQVEDESSLVKLASCVDGFFNSSPLVPLLHRSLNQYFYEVMDGSEISSYYDGGLKSEFFERFRNIKVYLPSIPSFSSLGSDLTANLKRGESKVFVSPSKTVQSWRNGRVENCKASEDFWICMLGRLVDEGMLPVVYRDAFSYDLSSSLPSGCVGVGPMDRLKCMSLMRSCGLVVDVFNGQSRFAIASRTPFLCFDERQRFNSLKEYELNDLCSSNLPKEYIFSFAALVEKGSASVWNSNLFDQMIAKIKHMKSNMDRDSWPSPVERYEIVPYDSVRKRKSKSMGTRFIKIPRV
jgi:hypothetical protein